MTVSELMRLLFNLPGDTLVLSWNKEKGIQDLSDPVVTYIKQQDNKLVQSTEKTEDTKLALVVSGEMMIDYSKTSEEQIHSLVEDNIPEVLQGFGPGGPYAPD